jgi:two-component system response regulator FixJ
METFPNNAPATVAIVDDDSGVRDSLTVLLNAAGYRTREYGSAEAFLREPLEGNPTCAIIDLRLPGVDGLALQAEMGRRGLAMPVILVTAHGDVASARQALRTGAVDFLEKPIDNEELLNAIRNAIEGRDRAQLERAADARATLLLGSLTQREREVIVKVGEGLKNKAIAARLFIAEVTVRHHLTEIYSKLGVSDRLELVIYAYIHGLAELPKSLPSQPE